MIVPGVCDTAGVDYGDTHDVLETAFVWGTPCLVNGFADLAGGALDGTSVVGTTFRRSWQVTPVASYGGRESMRIFYCSAWHTTTHR